MHEGLGALAMTMRPVITISEQDVPVLTQQLLDRMAADAFVPDAVLGIAKAGALVVDSLPETAGVARFRCTMQRPSTPAKQRAGLALRVLKKLPYRVTSLLRFIQASARERKTSVVPAPSESLVQDIDIIGAASRVQGFRRIAVIDDAVDSGVTLACVMAALKQRLPAEVAVRSGAITRTRSRAKTIIQPDYFIYENTECRFPWSPDYKGSS